MKIKLELFGASRDFSNQSYLEFESKKLQQLKILEMKLLII